MPLTIAITDELRLFIAITALWYLAFRFLAGSPEIDEANNHCRIILEQYWHIVDREEPENIVSYLAGTLNAQRGDHLPCRVVSDRVAAAMSDKMLEGCAVISLQPAVISVHPNHLSYLCITVYGKNRRPIVKNTYHV